MVVKKTAAICLLLSIVASTAPAAAATASPPAASEGVLDLSAWRFEDDGAVRLDGEWEFYWDRLLEPEAFAQGKPGGGVKVDVPRAWDELEFAGEPIPRFGYATYRLTVLLPPDTGVMAISVDHISAAYRLWINGEERAAVGRVGTVRGAETPRFIPQIVHFAPEGETVDILLHVSNFALRRGGFEESLSLGTADQLLGQREHSFGMAMLMLGCISIMGFYHIGLYARRRADAAPLYFGLFCLLVAVRIVVTDQMLITMLFPSAPYELYLKTEYLTYYLGLPVTAMFVHSVFPQEISSRIARLLFIPAIAFAAMVLITPSWVYTQWLIGYHAVTFVAVGYILPRLVVAVRRRREAAKLFVIGMSVGTATVVNDILYSYGVTRFPQALPFGVITFIFIQAYILASRFSEAFRRQEKLGEEKSALVRSLEAQYGELQASRRMLTQREEALRREMAERLHGRVQSRLTAIWLELGKLAAKAVSPLVQERLQAVRAAIDEVRERDVRAVSHLLHPAIIQVGLVPAVRSLAREFRGNFRVSVEVDPAVSRLDDLDEGGIPEGVRLTVYRVLEEALGNVQKHAGATRATVGLALAEGGMLDVRVTDDGRGFPTEEEEEEGKQRGLGLAAVAARLAEVGGSLRAASPPGGGMTVQARVPLREHAAKRARPSTAGPDQLVSSR